MFGRRQVGRIHAGVAHKFEFTVSDITIELASDNAASVSIDNLQLTWIRGKRSVCSNRTRVVERLDHATGQLSRTAHIMMELKLPCTLFADREARVGAAPTWDAKPSELLLTDSDADADADPTLCTAALDLADYASHTAPQLRSRVELELGDGCGRMVCSVHARRLGGADAADGGSELAESSVGGSEVASLAELGDALPAASSALPRPGANGCGGGSSSAAAGRLELGGGGGGGAAVEAEARWQEVYELERSMADARTIEGLHRDLGALIQDKQRLSEENLRLRATVAAMPSGKRAVAERIAGLEAELAGARKEAVAAEERLTTAFNGAMRELEGEIARLKAQRDEALGRLASHEKSSRRRTATAPPPAKPSPAQSPQALGPAPAPYPPLQGIARLGLEEPALPAAAPMAPPPPREPRRGLLTRKLSFGKDKRKKEAGAAAAAAEAASPRAAPMAPPPPREPRRGLLTRTLSFSGKDKRKKEAAAAAAAVDDLS